MIQIDADVVIVGAGFSGSLMAMLLQRIGLKPVLIDRGSHPRFVIGESSTPVANLILEGLARRFNLPRLAPLSNYATWKRTYPHITCGLKRGFSYFHHTLDQPFRPYDNRRNELLVAASQSDEDADTHWLRSDFDQFLFDEAATLKIPCFDRTSIDQLRSQGDVWELRGVVDAESCGSPHDSVGATHLRINANFLIDASGEGGFLAKHLAIEPHADGLMTRSRGLYSHFVNVRRWSDLYTSLGGDPTGHPFPCDDAALHHVFEGGWMWVLRFDQGVTSAGFSLDPQRFPRETAGTPESEWRSLLARLPSVAHQFADAKPIVPWRQTGRMQRRLAVSAGPNWVMLPNTAAFLDPLHSTGNTFTLIGIERLMGIFQKSWNQPRLRSDLEQYDQILQQEIEFIDQIVSGSFSGFCDFERMIAMSMFYFSTAIWSEEERRAGRTQEGAAYLSANHPRLRAALNQAVADVGNPLITSVDFMDRIRTVIQPFNRVGLCDPARSNMYPYEFSSPSGDTG